MRHVRINKNDGLNVSCGAPRWTNYVSNVLAISCIAKQESNLVWKRKLPNVSVCCRRCLDWRDTKKQGFSAESCFNDVALYSMTFQERAVDRSFALEMVIERSRKRRGRCCCRKYKSTSLYESRRWEGQCFWSLGTTRRAVVSRISRSSAGKTSWWTNGSSLCRRTDLINGFAMVW